MTQPLLILRPLDAARITEQKARKLGLIPIVAPLFEIRPLSWTAPPAARYDAIMFTSSNGVQVGGDALASYQHLPALAVGAVTGTAAKSAGFVVAVEGQAGVQSLLDNLPEDRFSNIIRIAGKQFTPVEDVRKIDTVAVYESASIELNNQARECLTEGSIVMLHSKRAAEMLAAEVAKNNIDPQKSPIVAISEKVAKAAGSGWKSTSIAEQPTDEALLALAARLCSI